MNWLKARRQRPNSVLILATLLISAVPGFAQSPEPDTSPVLVDRIVAIVDEEAILLSDLEREVELHRMERDYSGQNTGQDVDQDAAVVRREMLERLIESKLIIAAAKKADMSVDQKAISESVEQKINQFVEYLGSMEALEAELKREGMTLADYRARMAAQLRDQQYLRLVVGKFIRPQIEVKENEVRDYYLAHQNEMPTVPDSLTIADILIAVQPSPKVRQRVQEKVGRIQAALTGGMSFADAAREFSEDANAVKGGVIGVVSPDDLFDVSLGRAVFALVPGRVSEPLVSSRGVHLVRVDAVKDDGRRAISQIFLPIEITDADMAAARAQIDEARARVAGGESFALVAAEVSADAVSARNGGVLGTFQIEDLNESFQQALADVKAGGISEPVLTPAGWHVFQVIARIPGHAYTYEELQGQLRQMVESQKIEAALAEYVKGLRQRFFIDEKS